MASELRTIDDMDVEGRRVLLRADLNVPLTPGSAGPPLAVANDARIRAALPTIDELRRRGARLVVVSHLGRPQGPDPAWSMQPVANRLGRLTGTPVRLAPAVVGAEVRERTHSLAPGQMLMLENVRFEAGETRDDPTLASALADLADLYVDDAFASAYERDASTTGVARLLPSAAGRLMEREVNALSAVVDQPSRPLVAVLGGATLRHKIGLVTRFLELADVVCIGGGMCFPFLAALGHSVGHSLCPHDDVRRARTALVAADGRARLLLPEDLQLAQWGGDEGGMAESSDRVDVPDGWMGLDIGGRTAARFAEAVSAAATVFWNGPMGRFELPQFAAGTRAVAEAVASTSATAVVGGGETAEAVHQLRLEGSVSHLSTGGRAMRELLEGHELPGVEVLRCEVPAAGAPRPGRSLTLGPSGRR
ncbi:MAG: phosphoglycerate kinase [Solirubrobacterales bacterium]|nr:phosphoglycerate kinase [Solirubrobacterales bacterium]MBV9919125.1 phosphoglycerate kinase [Solirubrobacterales bacterium]